MLYTVLLARIGIHQGWMAKLAGGALSFLAKDRKLRGDEVLISAVPSSDVLIRRLVLDTAKELDAVIAFQMEPLLPVDEMVLDYQILRKEKGKTEVTVFAVPKSKLTMETEVISCIPAALAAVVPSSKKPVGVVHVGEETTCAIVHNGKVLAMHVSDEVAKTFYAMQTRLNLSLERIYSTGKDVDIETVPLPHVGNYAIALGLAKTSINFRKKGPFPWKRLKKPLITAACLMTVLTLSFWGLSHTLLTRKKAAIAAEYASLEALAGKQLPTENILQSARTLEKEMRAVPANYPLVPGVPSLREVVAYLSTLPITVDELRYQLVRYPNKKRPKEHYQVRVDLAVHTSDPRSLYDLLKKTPLIDPKKEIQWNTTEDEVHASFFLKDRTLYP